MKKRIAESGTAYGVGIWSTSLTIRSNYQRGLLARRRTQLLILVQYLAYFT